MSNPFEYLNSINFGKKNLMRGTENDDLAEKGYVSYITNRTLSYFPDTILYAQEMNTKHHISSRMQYEYLFNAVPKRKRFTKWHKKTKDEHVQLISEHYKISMHKAEEMCKVLNEEEIQQVIKRITDTGGY